MHSFICTHTKTLTLLNLLKLALVLLNLSWQLFKPVAISITFQHYAKKSFRSPLQAHINAQDTLALCWLVSYPCSSSAFIHWITQNLWLWVVKLSDRISNSCSVSLLVFWEGIHENPSTPHTHTHTLEEWRCQCICLQPTQKTNTSVWESVCLCKRAAPANNVVCDPSTCCMHVCKDPASDLTASIPDVTERHRRGIIKHSLEPSTAWRQTNPSTHKYTNTPDIHTTALRPVHISLWNVWFCSVLSLGVMNEQLVFLRTS